MNDKTELTFQLARIPFALGWAVRSAFGAMIATSVALAAFVVIGLISWAAVRGLQGVGICGVLGATVGASLKGPGSKLARVLGGGLGGVIAGYFAVASGEMVPPGTTQWAYEGGTFAALFALLVAALVGGVIGLLNAVSRSFGIDNASKDKGQPPAQDGADRP
jgi:hypothetical protein